MATNLPDVPAPRHQREPAEAVKAAARELGVQPATVEGWVHKDGRHYSLATVVRRAVAEGNQALAHRIWYPIHQAYESGRPIPELTPELIAEVQFADLDEDRCEAAYQANPSVANLRRWIEAMRVQHRKAGELLAAADQQERLSR